jgi:hypothetical protein
MYVVRTVVRIINKQPVTVYQVVNSRTTKVVAEYNEQQPAQTLADRLNQGV